MKRKILLNIMMILVLLPLSACGNQKIYGWKFPNKDYVELTYDKAEEYVLNADELGIEFFEDEKSVAKGEFVEKAKISQGGNGSEFVYLDKELGHYVALKDGTCEMHPTNKLVCLKGIKGNENRALLLSTDLDKQTILDLLERIEINAK